MKTWKLKKNHNVDVVAKVKLKKHKLQKPLPTPFFSEKDVYTLRATLSVFLFEIIIFVFVLFFSNFNSYALANTVNVRPGQATEKFITDLKNSGLNPSVNQKINRTSFSVPGVLVGLGDDSIQVFEYPDHDTALAEETAFSQKYTASTTVSFWKNTKHLYVKDRIVVFYMGREKNIIDSLDARFLTPSVVASTNKAN